MPFPGEDSNENKMIVDDIPLQNANIIKNNNALEFNNRITKDDISTPEKLTQLLISKKSQVLNIFEIKEFIDSGSESLVYKNIHKKTNVYNENYYN